MENFFGQWSITVTQKNAAFNQRFQIIGSTGSDGIYGGVVGFSLPSVAGESWQLIMEWNDGVSAVWQPSGVRRNISYELNRGLVIVLGADDNVEGHRDGDFDDLVLTCRNLEADLNPFPSAANPYDFSFPEKFLTPKKDTDKAAPDKR